MELASQDKRQIEKDLNSHLLRSLELKVLLMSYFNWEQSESDKLKEQEAQMGDFQLRQEELASLLSKDQPEKLGEKVQILVKKLKFVRTYKEQELKELKMKEMAKREILQMEQYGHPGGVGSVAQLQDEIAHYKDRYHSEKQTAETKQKELDAMEAKGATLKRTLLHDDSKLLQA